MFVIVSYFCVFILGAMCAIGLTFIVLKRIPSEKFDLMREKEKVKILMALIRLNLYKKRTFSAYFEQGNYKSIGIYGAGELGQLMYEILNKESIQVRCFVDRNDAKFYLDGLEWRKPTDELKDLDLIIVCAYDPQEEIINSLEVNRKKLITMSELVMELLYEE